MIFQDKLYKKSFLTLMRYIFYRFTQSDPFDSFDDFMDFSDSLGLQNAFYFKASTPGEKGHTYTYNDSRVVTKSIYCNEVINELWIKERII